MNYKNLKDQLLRCLENNDRHFAHVEADELLKKVALNTDLTQEQRKELVSIYDKVKKWFS